MRGPFVPQVLSIKADKIYAVTNAGGLEQEQHFRFNIA